MGIGVLCQRLAGAILNFYWSGEFASDGIKTYSVDAYKIAMLIIPIVIMGCFFFTFLIDEKKRKFCLNVKSFWHNKPPINAISTVSQNKQ
jgi:hypothetical protein